MDHKEDVFYTLLGVIEDEFRISSVENMFTAGSKCQENYTAMLAARERLCVRLNCDEDSDIEAIINSLLANQQILALKMFEYGQKFSRK